MSDSSGTTGRVDDTAWLAPSVSLSEFLVVCEKFETHSISAEQHKRKEKYREKLSDS